MSKVRVISMFGKAPEGVVVNACSNSSEHWSSGLSPFLLGPCSLYGNLTSRNMENSWQYSKLYPIHADANGMPTDDYWSWAKSGWDNPRAVRYPMGKGAVPLCSLWDGNKLGYIEARKKIYAPLYSAAVKDTPAFARLRELYESSDQICIRDFDGYDSVGMGMSLRDVLNFPRKKMGHAFVLAMLLENDPALDECR